MFDVLLSIESVDEVSNLTNFDPQFHLVYYNVVLFALKIIEKVGEYDG